MHRTRRAGLHGCAGGCANRSRERQPVCQRFQLRGWPSSYSDLRRPLSRLMMRITSATTRSRWMSPPAIWKLKPSSHRTKTTTKIVQSMYFSFTAWDTSWTSDKLAMFQSVRFDLSMDGNQPGAPSRVVGCDPGVAGPGALERDVDCDAWAAGVSPIEQVVAVVLIGDIHIVGPIPVASPVLRIRIEEREPIAAVLEARVSA
jgi:hypothetical protein